jgi:hypothetical protein
VKQKQRQQGSRETLLVSFMPPPPRSPLISLRQTTR